MKKFLKKIPDKYKIKLRPLLISLDYLICLLSFKQAYQANIGRVKVPFFARPWLKRSAAQQGEDLILDRIITRILGWDLNTPRTYVDVGGFHSIKESVTFLCYQRGWGGVVFDPSVATQKNFRFWRPLDKFVRAVVGSDDGIEVDFFITNNSNDMSLVNTKYPNGEGYRRVRTPQVNINDELLRLGVYRFDFLNLDVEGAEEEILNSFKF